MKNKTQSVVRKITILVLAITGFAGNIQASYWCTDPIEEVLAGLARERDMINDTQAALLNPRQDNQGDISERKVLIVSENGSAKETLVKEVEAEFEASNATMSKTDKQLMMIPTELRDKSSVQPEHYEQIKSSLLERIADDRSVQLERTVSYYDGEEEAPIFELASAGRIQDENNQEGIESKKNR